jgi:hypothetical protein
MKPNLPVIRRWVAALRSGKYKQARGGLCNAGGDVLPWYLNNK